MGNRASSPVGALPERLPLNSLPPTPTILLVVPIPSDFLQIALLVNFTIILSTISAMFYAKFFSFVAVYLCILAENLFNLVLQLSRFKTSLVNRYKPEWRVNIVLTRPTPPSSPVHTSPPISEHGKLAVVIVPKSARLQRSTSQRFEPPPPQYQALSPADNRMVSTLQSIALIYSTSIPFAPFYAPQIGIGAEDILYETGPKHVYAEPAKPCIPRTATVRSNLAAVGGFSPLDYR